MMILGSIFPDIHYKCIIIEYLCIITHCFNEKKFQISEKSRSGTIAALHYLSIGLYFNCLLTFIPRSGALNATDIAKNRLYVTVLFLDEP
jgi:hypothetical protein